MVTLRNSPNGIDDLTGAMSRALISRGRVLKGLGAGLIVPGFLTSLGASRARAQAAADLLTIWRQVFTLSGNVSGRRTFDYQVGERAVKHTESSTATFDLRLRYYPFAVPGFHYFSTSGQSSAEYHFKSNEPDFIYTEDGSGSKAITGEAHLNVLPVDAPSFAANKRYGIGLIGGVPVNTTWESLRKDSNGIWQRTSGSSTKNVAYFGSGWEPPAPPPLSGSNTEGDQADPVDGQSSVSWSIADEDFLPNIPRIMRHYSWLNGARLQERWFSGPPRVVGRDFNPNDAPKAPKDTTTIKMNSWVLTFPRARQVFDELVQRRRWTTVKAKEEIVRMLRRKGLIDTRRHSFGNLDAPVPGQDKDYVQQLPVRYGIEDVTKLNDMVAALGDFNLRCVVAGYVEPVLANRGTHQVVIKEVGVYVRDVFDFQGEQFLGYWNDSPFYVSTTERGLAMPISNTTYRAWRAVHGRGGDFMVFSDLKRVRLDPPTRFNIG